VYVESATVGSSRRRERVWRHAVDGDVGDRRRDRDGGRGGEQNRGERSVNRLHGFFTGQLRMFCIGSPHFATLAARRSRATK
jgi:hypothetical protein